MDLTRPVSSRGIAEAIFRAVRNGELTEGTALPSVRRLADEVGASPGTVALAYRMLREQGVITTAHGKRAEIAARPPVPRASMVVRLPPEVRDLTTTTPDVGLLPRVQDFFSDDLYVPSLYEVGNVAPELHEVMRAHFDADGIGGDLTVTSGALDFLERLLLVRLRPGESVVVEDPMWTSSLSLLRTLGLEPVGVTVDDEGMLPGALAATLERRRCSAVLTTPRAQNPYGSALSARRAAELREVLEAHPELLVMEDDHASLIAGSPAVTLTEGRQNWAVIRSMGKALGPDLRVAVTASDRTSADLVQGRQSIGPGWVSHLLQRIVARLLSSSQAQQLVARADREYALRREALLGELAARGIEGHGRSGLNVAIAVPDEGAVVANLALRGWGVRAGEHYRLASDPFVRVCTSTLTPVESSRFAADLDEVLHSAGSRRD